MWVYEVGGSDGGEGSQLALLYQARLMVIIQIEYIFSVKNF